MDQRYSILQKKVEDLERVHNQAKKSHTAEVERLKLELSRCRKSVADKVNHAEKQAKQIVLMESRIHDLKKTTSSDQSEIRDLRMKLRISEQERNQLVSKLGRKDEVAENIATERKKREALQIQMTSMDEELKSARAATQDTQARLTSVTNEAERLRSALNSAQAEHSETEKDLVDQLATYKLRLGEIAKQYSKLASNTAPLSMHRELEHECAALKIRMLRSERKLANSDSQVIELAHLIRQVKEENLLLQRQLRDAIDEIFLYAGISNNETNSHPNDETLTINLQEVKIRQQEFEQQTSEIARLNEELAARFYSLQNDFLQVAFCNLLTDLAGTEITAQRSTRELSNTIALREAALEQLEKEIALLKEHDRETHRMHETAMSKEKDIVKRLTSTVQQSRIAEEALRTDNEQLTSELADLERYRDAYLALSEQVELLVSHNQLAEEEAGRLSKFNAEILSHNNPAQKIVYVDRIRKELAEAKHQIASLKHEQEVVLAHNDELQEELDMYTSVMVPVTQKPRTAITRVVRPPSVNVIQGPD